MIKKASLKIIIKLNEDVEKRILSEIENSNFYIISGMLACKKDFDCSQCKLKTYENCTILLHEYLIKHYPEELL